MPTNKKKDGKFNSSRSILYEFAYERDFDVHRNSREWRATKLRGSAADCYYPEVLFLPLCIRQFLNWHT